MMTDEEFAKLNFRLNFTVNVLLHLTDDMNLSPITRQLVSDAKILSNEIKAELNRRGLYSIDHDYMDQFFDEPTGDGDA